jgi:hypothetical protein
MNEWRKEPEQILPIDLPTPTPHTEWAHAFCDTIGNQDVGLHRGQQPQQP